jgi:hypothetical protein
MKKKIRRLEIRKKEKLTVNDIFSIVFDLQQTKYFVLSFLLRKFNLNLQFFYFLNE